MTRAANPAVARAFEPGTGQRWTKPSVRESVTELTTRVNELSGMISKVTRAATRVAGIASTAIGGLKAGAKLFGIGRKKKQGAARDLDVPEHDERPRLRRRR